MLQQWENVYFFAETPNAMWEIWKMLFLQVLDKHAPLQHKSIRTRRVPWIMSSIKELINTRDKLKRKAIILQTYEMIGQITKELGIK